MSTNPHRPDPVEGLARDPRMRLALVAAVLVAGLSALWGAMESHYRSCVMAAEARFPGVPVSALTTRDTGPLKLSFVAERQRAVDGCGRLPF